MKYIKSAICLCMIYICVSVIYLLCMEDREKEWRCTGAGLTTNGQSPFRQHTPPTIPTSSSHIMTPPPITHAIPTPLPHDQYDISWRKVDVNIGIDRERYGGIYMYHHHKHMIRHHGWPRNEEGGRNTSEEEGIGKWRRGNEGHEPACTRGYFYSHAPII